MKIVKEVQLDLERYFEGLIMEFHLMVIFTCSILLRLFNSRLLLIINFLNSMLLILINFLHRLILHQHLQQAIHKVGNFPY
jgi:hypothetical protein